MISMPENLPDDPVLLKQLLEQMINERASDKGKIVHLKEEVALLRQRLFGRKTEQPGDAATPQLPLFDEAESLAEPLDEVGDEEVVAPTKPVASASRCRLTCRVSKLSTNCPCMNRPALAAAANMP